MTTYPRRQSSLGSEFKRRYKEGQNIDRIMIAEIVRVHHRYNTVDVVIKGTNDRVENSYYEEGKFSAKLPVEFGGLTGEGNPFGKTIPIQVGTLALIGFINGNKTTPIVLSIYNKTEEAKELSRSPIAETGYDDDRYEQYTDEQFTVYPSLTYDSIDGKGNRTVSFTGKTFIATSANPKVGSGSLTDDSIGLPYENLGTSYYHSGKLIEPKESIAPSILFKHQGDTFDYNGNAIPDDKIFTLFLDNDGTFRVSTRQAYNNWRSQLEIGKEGRISFKFQNDTDSIIGSKKYNELFIDDEGIGFVIDGKLSKLTKDGIRGDNPFGGGGSSIPNGFLNEVKDSLKEINDKIIKQDVGIIQTEDSVKIYSEKLQELEAEYKRDRAEWVLTSDEIKSTVQTTVIEKINELGGQLTDENLQIYFAETKLLKEKIDEYSKDSIINSTEKIDLQTIWEIIQNEYETYLNHAKTKGLSTDLYTNAYERLNNYIINTKLFDDLESNTAVNPSEFNDTFYLYLDMRSELVLPIFNEFNDKLYELADSIIKTGTVAVDSIAYLNLAKIEIEDNKRRIREIIKDNIITGQDKNRLYDIYSAIKTEYRTIVKRAEAYELEYIYIDEYTNAYDTLVSLLEGTYDLFSNLSGSTEINRELVIDTFDSYYEAKLILLESIYEKATKELNDLKLNFKDLSTEISQTNEEILLQARSLESLKNDLKIQQAQIRLTPQMIEQTVSSTLIRRQMLENELNSDSASRNMYSEASSSKGMLNIQTGEIDNNKDSKVSSFITITPNIDHTATVFNNSEQSTLKVCYYDENKNLIRGFDYASSDKTYKLTTTPPEGSRYARVSISSENVLLQFERGKGTAYYVYNPIDSSNTLESAKQDYTNKKENLNYLTNLETRVTIRQKEFLEELNTMLEDLEINSNEAEQLSLEKVEIVTEYNDILDEAKSQNVVTTVMDLSYTSLINKIEEVAKAGTVLSNKEALITLFTKYYNSRNDVLNILKSNSEKAVIASENILNEITKTAEETERLANEIAKQAELASYDVDLLTYLITEADKNRILGEKQLGVILEDDRINAGDIVSMYPYLDEIEANKKTLNVQTRVYGIDTTEYDSAYSNLQSIWEYYTTPEVTAQGIDLINKETGELDTSFKDALLSCYEQQFNIMQTVLDNAKRQQTNMVDKSVILQEERRRREIKLANIQNAIEDSKLAIIDIQDKIDKLEVSNIHTLYLTSTNGTTFKNRVIQTQLIAELYKDGENITETIPNENIVWYKRDKNGELDTSWNTNHKGIGNKIDVSHKDVDERATFTVEIYEVG